MRSGNSPKDVLDILRHTIPDRGTTGGSSGHLSAASPGSIVVSPISPAAIVVSTSTAVNTLTKDTIVVVLRIVAYTCEVGEERVRACRECREENCERKSVERGDTDTVSEGENRKLLGSPTDTLSDDNKIKAKKVKLVANGTDMDTVDLKEENVVDKDSL